MAQGWWESDNATVYLDPVTTHTLIGSTFIVNICVANVTDLFSYSFALYYDTDLLDAVEVKLPKDHFLKPVKPSNIWIAELDTKDYFNSTHGSVSVGVTLLSPEQGKSGQGVLATISFHVRKSGTCVLVMHEPDTILVNSQTVAMGRNVNDGYFECAAEEHDVVVYLEVPSHLVPKESVEIDMHVQNAGLSDEKDVALYLIIDGITVDTVQVKSMATGSSYTLSYRWAPQDEAKYNVTGYVPSLAGESSVLNNADSKIVAVSYVIRVPTDFLAINEAIRAASPGDTVRVAPGTYYEHVMIDRSVTLVGENVNETIIDGEGTWKVVQVGGERRYGWVGGASKITGFTIQNGLIGIYVESDDNVIEENILRNCEFGIYVFQAGGNVIRRNTITDNGNGIACDGIGNQIYHNNVINNTQQVLEQGSNEWSHEDEGNYWSDYNGTDTDKDERGDVPYSVNITQGTWDYFPLVFAYTFVAGDLNDDGNVDMLDLGVVAASFGTSPRHARWSSAADANYDGKVDMMDLVVVAKNFGKTR